ncbi:hypothetical protein GCM10020295_57350 [Streptomyces cinereospinus]
MVAEAVDDSVPNRAIVPDHNALREADEGFDRYEVTRVKELDIKIAVEPSDLFYGVLMLF